MRRRRTFGFAAISGITAIALAACGGGSSPSPSPTAAAYGAAIKGVVNPSSAKGGTIVFSQSSTPDSTDPGNTYYAFQWNMSRLYATPLMTYKSCTGTCGLQLVPGLATAPGTPSSDGLTWTYHIKSGMKFSDGSPITSADVKYAIERTFAKDVLVNGPSYWQVLLAGNAAKYKGPYKDPKGDLTSVDTPNATTIVFHLAKPFADMNYVAAIPQTAPVPKDKDKGANYQLDPISSGPYMFQSYQLNKQYTLVKNPNWNPALNPQVKQLANKIVVNLNANANDIDNRLLAGDIQVDQAGTGVQSAARAKILSNPNLKANADDPVTGFMWFEYINTKVAPLNNVHCRRAIEYGANKTTLQNAYGGPYGGDIASTAIPPNIVGFQKFDLYNALSKPSGDIANAKKELAACGHPNGFTTGMAYRSDRPRETQAAQALQASLAPIGIKLQLKGFPSGNYFSNFAGVPNYMHSHDIGVADGGWGADWPDAWGYLYSLVSGKSIVPAGNTNIGELNDPVVNNALDKMQAPGVSQAEKNTLTQQVNMQVMKDAVMLPGVYSKALLYRPTDLSNVMVQPYYGQYDYATLGMK
ncbi:MAG: ABC transporter substrate-binding protein, partial [Streptosporangiaceae bacterium]